MNSKELVGGKGKNDFLMKAITINYIFHCYMNSQSMEKEFWGFEGVLGKIIKSILGTSN